MALSYPLDVQTQEEDFDMALLKELEENVVTYLGHPRVPDALVSQLARILYRGSEIYPHEDVSSPTPTLGSKKSSISDSGTTELAQMVPRERFSYWCFDLLFNICCSSPGGKFMFEVIIMKY